jgi:CRISPR-associated protein Cmr4
MLSFFAQNACEIAQHVRISDETGTAETGGLFNQENVPSETLFFAIVRAFKERTPHRQGRPAETALDTFASKIKAEPVFQFGGDASTGLGYCSVSITGRKGE